jgi:hypothetical protein
MFTLSAPRFLPEIDEALILNSKNTEFYGNLWKSWFI